MDWFFLLNRSSNSLLSNKKVRKDGVVVCNEGNGYKQFTTFRYIQLYEFCISLPDEKRCLFEIIFGNKAQKPYFDIDIDMVSESQYTKKQRLAISKNLVPLIIETIVEKYPQIRLNQIAVFSSNSDEKRSYHIIITKWYVTNCKNNRKFFDSIMENIPTPWRQFVDASMYKNLQQFRLFMSTKYGKGRIKNLDPEFSRWEAEDEENPTRDAFLSSLIGYTKDCDLIPFDEDENDYGNIESVEITREDHEKLKMIIGTMPYSSCFSISEIGDTFVSLRRNRASKCINSSDAYHEHENPFVYITYAGNVKFNCRRCSESKSIGHIDGVTVKKPEKKSKSADFFQDEPKIPSPIRSPVSVDFIETLKDQPKQKIIKEISQIHDEDPMTKRIERRLRRMNVDQRISTIRF